MTNKVSGATRARYRVTGMDCGACARKVDTAVRRVPGVADVSVSVQSGNMTVSLTDEAVDPHSDIAGRVSALGYNATLLSPIGAGAMADGTDVGSYATTQHIPGAADAGQQAAKRGHDSEDAEDGPWWRTAKARLTLVSGAGLALAWFLAKLIPEYTSWLYVAAMIVGLVPIARRSFGAALNGSPFTIETLMTIAAVGAVVIGAAEEAAVVVLLFLVGELLEGVAAGRARASIRALTSLVPKTAFLDQGGRLAEVPAEALRVDDTILVRPGDRIPADGEIVSGTTAVDEAPVTGESEPRRKEQGGQVFAGTIILESAVRVRVTAAAADNTIARVVRLVEEAQEAKAPTERFIDRFSRYYTPAVLVTGALVAVVPPLLSGAAWSEWIYKGLAVILIGCPCALVISTPAAIAAGLAAGARRGLLIKGGAVLEALGKVTTVAFDKTGTLTEGRPQVTDVIAIAGTERDVLAAAASLDAASSHPVAKAIVARAIQDGLQVSPADDVEALGGKGVAGRQRSKVLFLGSPKAAAERTALTPDIQARIGALQDDGKTVSVMVMDGQATGLIAVRDEPRPDAVEGVRALAARGIGTVMLTGDNARTAAAIGRLLGITPRADLMPDDKLTIVNEFKRQGQVVAKVGDGINDAPALAAADVGIAMGGGTDVALETADGAVLHGRVLDIPRMIALSQATMANIRQNIVIALGLKAVFLVTTVLGITGLWPAILADTGATVLVTGNAMRLLGWRGG